MTILFSNIEKKSILKVLAEIGAADKVVDIRESKFLLNVLQEFEFSFQDLSDASKMSLLLALSYLSQIELAKKIKVANLIKGIMEIDEYVDQREVDLFNVVLNSMGINIDYLVDNNLLQETETLEIQQLRILAEKGNSPSQHNLGLRYFTGNGVKKDFEKAFYWYTKSAEQGNKFSLNSLGKMYYYGTYVHKDYAQSFKYFLASAMLEYPDSMNYVGSMYLYGLGVELNKGNALVWFKKGADLGYEPCIENLRRIEISL